MILCLVRTALTDMCVCHTVPSIPCVTFVEYSLIWKWDVSTKHGHEQYRCTCPEIWMNFHVPLVKYAYVPIQLCVRTICFMWNCVAETQCLTLPVTKTGIGHDADVHSASFLVCFPKMKLCLSNRQSVCPTLITFAPLGRFSLHLVWR
jgi:hypothetical protein